MTKIIGLTGGIGSGKTTVAKQFETYGVPIYIADEKAKSIMEAEATLHLIRQNFGTAIFDKEILNRQKLAAIVFENPEKLQQLNNIVHPLVQRDFELWLQQHRDAIFIIKEAAILFESGSYKDCDKIITVIAPLEVRIERVMQRNKTEYESVLKRINNQWTDAMRIAKSDYIITNENLQKTIEETRKIYELLNNLQK